MTRDPAKIARRVSKKNQPSTAPAGETKIDVSLGNILIAFVGRNVLDDCPEVRAKLPFEPGLVPQTRDLFNLFDTTPDLSGADIDIGRFIRDGEDLDSFVFWRDESSGLGRGDLRNGCPFKKLLPAPDELCPVTAWRFRKFFQSLNAEQKQLVWVRDHRKGWIRQTDPDRIYPGQTFLLHKRLGGYDTAVGWTGIPGECVFEPCPPKERVQDPGEGDTVLQDEENAAGDWESVHRHSVKVAEALNAILFDAAIHDALKRQDVSTPLVLVPPCHDLGKAHEKFFAKLSSTARSEWPMLSKGDHPAKAPNEKWKSFFHEDEDNDESDARFKRRRGFRHELASALALLEILRLAKPDHAAVKIENELRAALASTSITISDSQIATAAMAALGPIADLDRIDFNLLLYLVACHHGKVRLGLRSNEDDYDFDQTDPVPEPRSGDERIIRRCLGVQDNDIVPACRLPDSFTPADENRHVVTPQLTISLDPMEAFSTRYGASWVDRMREVLEVLGPFRLGYLEALIRAADARGSLAQFVNQSSS